MEARATAKYVRVSSRKAKLVADLIRGKSLGEALSILALTPNKAAKITEKVVKSALATRKITITWILKNCTSIRSTPIRDQP